MNTNMKTSRTGGALFGVMVFVMIMSIVIGTVMSASSYRTTMIDHVRDRMQASAYAEAGANYIYATLTTNWAVRENYPTNQWHQGSLSWSNRPSLSWSSAGSNEFGEGWYGASVQTQTLVRATITSIGFCGDAHAVVIMDALNYGDADDREWDERWWESEAWEFAMICGSSFDFGGCGSVTTVDGTCKIHSNQALVIRGSAATGMDVESSVSITCNNHKCDIDGDATAPTITLNGAEVVGDTVIGPVDQIPTPNINLTPWQNEASRRSTGSGNPADDTYFTGDLDLNGGTYVFESQTVWYVEGNVTMSADLVLSNVCIVATGDIANSCNWQSTITPPTDQFAFASINGDITITTSGLIDVGVMYAKTGDYTMNANGVVKAQVVAAGEISKAGNSDALVYSGIIPMPPGWEDWPSDTAGEDIIGVSAWQK